MTDKIFDNNQVSVAGEVVSAFTFSHEVFGEGFYCLHIRVGRLSDSYDVIPLMISERLMDVKADYHELEIQNMALASDYITVQKEWHNALDARTASGIQLTVTKDGRIYLNDKDHLFLSEENNWTSDKEYISAGFITTTTDGRYNVREPGHDYTVTEPESFSYYWDLTAAVYRPMVVDGTLKMLIKTDSPTGTEGTDYYVINGKKYQVAGSSPTLIAQNNRRSNLNLKKLVTANTQAVDNVPDPDDVFTYTITITDVNGDAVWFSAMNENETTVPIESYSSNVTAAVDDEGNPTGSYSVPSGAQFTISIKAGLNVRFFNLPRGTAYSIRETGMEDGYEFVKAETSAEVTKPEFADDFKATPGTVSGDTVTGTIDMPNNVYSAEYTNNWNPNNEIVIIKTDENGAKLAGASFRLSKHADNKWEPIKEFTSGAEAGETLKVGRGLYKLEETSAPANYAKADNVFFKVETSGNTTTVTLTDENGQVIDGTESPAVYPDVSVSGNEVTVKNTPVASAEATKAWKNADGTGTAPAGASVVFTLYADGKATNYTVTLDGTADAAPAGIAPAGYESEAWKAKFVNLPKYGTDGTTEIKYTIAETTGWESYEMDPKTAVANGKTITNRQIVTVIQIKKIGDWTVSNPLSGVQFKLYSDETCTKQITKDSTGKSFGTDGIITTGDGGIVTIGALIPGTYYLKEVASVPGYNLRTEVSEFTIKKDGTIEYATGNNNFDCTTYAFYELEDGGYGIFINNESGVELPHTGGPGTNLFYLLGMMLACAAGTGFVMRKRRRNA